MKDLMKLVEENKRNLAFLNIRIGKVRNWSVNTRTKARMGCRVRVSKGLFDTQISAYHSQMFQAHGKVETVRKIIKRLLP
mgnify:CR=1 FL=1